LIRSFYANKFDYALGPANSKTAGDLGIKNTPTMCERIIVFHFKTGIQSCHSFTFVRVVIDGLK
jgi:hypothetical protein